MTHAIESFRCFKTDVAYLSQPEKIAELFPSVNLEERQNNQKIIHTCLENIAKAADCLELPIDKIESAVKNIFAHYRYHKLNCWNIYRSVFPRSCSRDLRIKRNDFLQKAFNTKMQELLALLALKDQSAFLLQLNRSHQGNQLSLTCPTPKGDLTVESFYLKEDRLEKFTYSYRFS